MNKHAITVLIFSLAFKVSQFIGMVFVNNIFENGQIAGRFFLTISCANVGLVLINFGHAAFYTRILSGKEGKIYSWANDLRDFIFTSSLFAVPVGIGFGIHYQFANEHIIALVLILIFMNFSYSTSGIARSFDNYLSSFLMQGLHNGIWPLMVFVSYFTTGLTQYSSLLLFYGISVLSMTILPLWWLNGHFKLQGEVPIPYNVRKDSFVFYMIAFTATALPYIDKLLVAANEVDLSILAAYQGVILPFSVFDSLMIGIGWVLLPKFAKTKEINASNIHKNLLLVFGFSVGLSVFIWALAPVVIHVIYQGRFDGYSNLYPYFILIGILKQIYAVLSSIIGGASNQKDLMSFGFITVIIMVGGVFLMNTGLVLGGLQGMVQAMAVLWIARCLTGYLIVKKNYNVIQSI